MRPKRDVKIIQDLFFRGWILAILGRQLAYLDHHTVTRFRLFDHFRLCPDLLKHNILIQNIT